MSYNQTHRISLANSPLTLSQVSCTSCPRGLSPTHRGARSWTKGACHCLKEQSRGGWSYQGTAGGYHTLLSFSFPAACRSQVNATVSGISWPCCHRLLYPWEVASLLGLSLKTSAEASLNWLSLLYLRNICGLLDYFGFFMHHFSYLSMFALYVEQEVQIIS